MLVEMDEHLGVAMIGAKMVTGGLELLAQFEEIVYFAVEHDRDGVVFVEHRLMAGLDI